MDLVAGLTGSLEHVVTEDDTSAHMGTSDVAVLGTPRLILLAEQAIRAALDGHLDPDMSAVEHRVEISHLAPTPIGMTVRAEALLESVDGRRLVFRVSVTDGRGLVAAGRFTRVVVARQRFLDRAGSTE